MNRDHLERLNAWGVPRETFDRIDLYIGLLYKWQQRINLISSPRGIDEHAFRTLVWERHVIDSLQLLPWMGDVRTMIDIGSGAGFPGLLLSMVVSNPVCLVESDARKCEFLKEAARQVASNARVICKRMEQISADEFSGDVMITSRACASISKLLELTQPLHPRAEFVLLKGETATVEVAEALHQWRMNHQVHPSVTNAQSCVITMSGVTPNG